MALKEVGSFSVLGLKSTVGSMIGSYWICDGLSKLIFILSMFFNGLVFGSCGSSGRVIFLGERLEGDSGGSEVGCCVNVLIRCAITELRIGFSGIEFDLQKNIYTIDIKL